jgi:hypothetical protein
MIELRTRDTAAAAQDALARTRDRLADFPALHRRIGDAVIGFAQRNLAAEGALLDDFPSGWPALSPRTLAARLRRGRGTRMLYDTGRLAGSFVAAPEPSGVSVDNLAPYAAAQQEGRGVPRRPIFPESPQAERLATDAAQAFVTDALQGGAR